MRLRSNILANYAGQAYVTLVGLLVVPAYLEGLGQEGYGLVGFFAMLQGWFMLLDFGMTATLGREIARAGGGASLATTYRRLYKFLSTVSAAIAVAAAATIWLAAEPIARRWLGENSLDPADVVLALQVMAVALGCRWLAGLYRGVLVGAERLVSLNGLNAVFATLRFLAVFASLEVFGWSVRVFFLHQFVVALLEVACLRVVATRIVQGLPTADGIAPESASLRPQIRFALSVTLTSSLWVAVTQSDKLILSGLLSLAEFGLYSMATLLASGVLLVALPITGALLPRLAALDAEGHPAELIRVYRQLTRLVGMTAGAAMLTLAFFAEPVIRAWTGNDTLGADLRTAVALYAVGNGCLNFSSFVYGLQYARGRVGMHALGNVLLLAGLLPLLFWLTPRWGLVGAGMAWASVNVLYLLLWVSHTHARLVPGLAGRWLVFDVVAVLLPGALGALALSLLVASPVGRVATIAYLAVAGGTVLVLCWLGQGLGRRLEATLMGTREGWALR